MRTAAEAERILLEEGVIARRDHPELVGALDWMLRGGVIRTVLPGVYALVERAGDFEIRVAAVGLRDPDAVIVGAAAARLTYDKSASMSIVEVASRRLRTQSGPITIKRRTIRPELILDERGLRVSAPALTALDLAGRSGGDSIDTVLRLRQATLADLHNVLELTRKRQGNSDIRRLLLESRAEPWSTAERHAHQALRAAGIAGWCANHRVVVDRTSYYLDIAFSRQRLAVEIDGREHHGPKTFDSERWRQNAIIFAGWHLLRFSADVVMFETDAFVGQIADALVQWAC